MKNRPALWLVRLLFMAWTPPFQTVRAVPPGLPRFQEESSSASLPAAPSPAGVINAVNNLRLASGLHALNFHPVLMEVAARQANALAASEGAIGHERPCGMTLEQQAATQPAPSMPTSLSNSSIQSATPFVLPLGRLLPPAPRLRMRPACSSDH